MWLELFFSNLLALVIGVVTGFYFEHRTTKVAQRDAAVAEERAHRLEEVITNLRAELFSRNVHPGQAQRPVLTSSLNVVHETLEYARERQDASGRIKSTTLRNGLMERGYSAADVEVAIRTLVEQDSLLPDGSQWKVIS